MDERVRTRQGATVEVDEARAVQELSEQLAMPGTSAVVTMTSTSLACAEKSAISASRKALLISLA